MLRPDRETRRRRQCGSVLLEAFIGMLLFSMGILALMGLQATATRNSTEARYRVEAAYLANQIIGQMWADNRANLPTYVHNPSGNNCNFTGGASQNANVKAWIGSSTAYGTVMHTLPGALSTRQQITVGANNQISVTLCWLAPGETIPRRVVTVAQIA
jgi:type IV pilus assembly protein PilV